MRCLFIAEGSHQIGAGHQVRSAALAKALIQRGHLACLCARNLLGSSHIWAWHGFEQIISDSEDALDVIKAAHAEYNPDFMVVDHYHSDLQKISQLNPQLPLLVRDDVPRSRSLPSMCLVLNSGLGIEPDDYPHQVSLCGAAWHLLADVFYETAWRPEKYLLLCLGMSDTYALMDRAIDYVLQAYTLPMRIVCSEEQAIRLQDRGPRVRYCYNEDAAGMAALLAGAKHAVLSASSLALEAMAIGLPFTAIHHADNQRLLAQALEQEGVAVFQSAALHIAIDAALALIRAPYVQHIFSRTADMHVVQRMILYQQCARRGDIRGLRWSDARDTWEWANDQQTRALSFSDRSFIPWQEHCVWLRQALKDPQRQAYMFLEHNTAVAMLRLDVLGAEAKVGIVVAPAARGRGIAVRALKALIQIHRHAAHLASIVAEIKTENNASLKSFERSGFLFKENCQVNGHEAQRWIYDFKQQVSIHEN